ncbi:MAG: anthranilate/aminodeoxychorismate synthase component II [Candidatus Omnitrophota bacterium]|nr:MAG: anthranilate/aminodeoxychorismate synthase component II [Candidatus Omnitrophota bacterium]
MILLIDNYDSFSYNLVQYLGELGQKIKVVRNDEVGLNWIEKNNPDYIVISPGPCTPKEAGISCKVIKKFSGIIPILGVCLGHQCIGYAYGALIQRAKRIMHGKTSLITHNKKSIFKNILNPFVATRYHSLIIKESSLPNSFMVTARSEDGTIMAIQHCRMPLWGVQFHPESILTVQGKNILANFLKQGKSYD